jgi:hypothetical protein
MWILPQGLCTCVPPTRTAPFLTICFLSATSEAFPSLPLLNWVSTAVLMAPFSYGAMQGFFQLPLGSTSQRQGPILGQPIRVQEGCVVLEHSVWQPFIGLQPAPAQASVQGEQLVLAEGQAGQLTARRGLVHQALIHLEWKGKAL